MAYFLRVPERIPTLDECYDHAEELSQNVINAWGETVSIGHADKITAEFKALFEVTCRYRDAKSHADNRRQFEESTGYSTLTEEEIKKEDDARRAFAKAYKDFAEAHSD